VKIGKISAGAHRTLQEPTGGPRGRGDILSRP
jgi:hypothetical protein